MVTALAVARRYFAPVSLLGSSARFLFHRWLGSFFSPVLAIAAP